MGKCRTIMLLITYSCNLNCIYCYEPKTLHKRMSKEQAMSYIQNIVDSSDDSYSEFEVQYMGGEPLLEFNLVKDVSEWLWSREFRIPLARSFVLTNGTLLNEEMKSWFSANRDRICLGLSFDGDNLMQNINRSQSSSRVDLSFFAANWPDQTVKMTISPDTAGRLSEGVKYLVSKGLHRITADLAMGNKVNWSEGDIKVLWEQLQILSAFYIDNPSLPLFSMLDMDVFAPVRERRTPVVHCSCGEDLVCVDTDGEEYACHLFSPVSISRKAAKEAKNFDFSCKQKYYSEDCLKCSLLAVCPHCYGMNFSIAGDLSAQSDFTCKSTKVIFLASCYFRLEKAKRENDAVLQSQIEEIISNFKLL